MRASCRSSGTPRNARGDVEAVRKIIPCATPKEVARRLKGFADAGMRVVKIMDYGGIAALKFTARSAQNVREAEDELMRLMG